MSNCPTCFFPFMSDDTLEAAIQKWGKEAQMDQAIEECAELIVALRHLRRGKATPEQVASEVADVLIMVGQLRIMLEYALVDRAVRAKMERLEERLGQ